LLSLQQGYFTAAAKAAIVVPVSEKPMGDACEPGYYRPISNLSFLSKLLEGAVFFYWVQELFTI